MLDVVLEVQILVSAHHVENSFNPCCAGCSSGRTVVGLFGKINLSFNPCCAGCSSGRKRVRPIQRMDRVSILVVLDVVLEVCRGKVALFS